MHGRGRRIRDADQDARESETQRWKVKGGRNKRGERRKREREQMEERNTANHRGEPVGVLTRKLINAGVKFNWVSSGRRHGIALRCESTTGVDT